MLKVFKFILTLITGMVLGVAILLGSIFIIGRNYWTKSGSVGKIEDQVLSKTGLPIKFNEEIRGYNLNTYTNTLLETVMNVTGTPLSKLSEVIGTNKLIETIASSTGLDEEDISGATLNTIGDVLADKMTPKILKEHFNVNFPDMPLFSDEVFLNTSIKTAFQSLGDRPLDDFIKITYAPNPDACHIILQKIGKKKPLELAASNTLGDIVSDLKLGEILTINEDSEPILRALKDTKIGEVDAKAKTLTIQDIFENPDRGAISLIPSSTLVKDIPKEIGNALATASIYSLKVLGIVSMDEPQVKSRNLTYNMNNTDAVKLIANIVGEDLLTPELPKTQYVKLIDSDHSVFVPNAADPINPLTSETRTIDLSADTTVTQENIIEGQPTYVITQQQFNAWGIAPGTVFLIANGLNVCFGSAETTTSETNVFATAFSVNLSKSGSVNTRVAIAKGLSVITEIGGYMSFVRGIYGKIYSYSETTNSYEINTGSVQIETLMRGPDDLSKPMQKNILIEFDPE